MSSRSQSHPSFFKLLMEDDFFHTLRIPPAFMARDGGELGNDVWLLQPSTLEMKFSTQVEKYGPYHFLRGPGWRKFATSMNLRAGDLLLFRCVVKSRSDRSFHIHRHSLFTVEVYDGSGLAKTSGSPPARPGRLSQKQFKAKDKRVKEEPPSEAEESAEEEEEKEEGTNSDNESEEEEALGFTLTFRKGHKERLVLPADFTRKSSIKEKKAVSLINPISGKKWYAELRHNSNGTSIGKGWVCFTKENNLKVGGEYSFTLVQDDVECKCNTLLFHRISK